MEILILSLILLSTYLMVFSKRIPALIRNFQYQSFFIFSFTLFEAVRQNHLELYIIALLLLLIKVYAIPHFLIRITRRIKINHNVGLFINSQLSLFCALLMTLLSWVFSRYSLHITAETLCFVLTVAFTVTLLGMFIMIFRMKAIAQIVGLLVMENGIFILASSMAGGMPFFVEITIFLDVFISVIILGIFVYKINKLFTHIDVDKLSELKG